MKARSGLIGILVAALLGAVPVFAQQQSTEPALPRGSIVSPILTIDSERAFNESAFGKRVTAEREAEREKLLAEFHLIEKELEAEELALTELRGSLPAEEFRELADAFDAKVHETRAAQTARGRALSAQLGKDEEIFRKASLPILERLMRESGAAVILERRSVFVSVNAVDITSDAILLLDETLGSGAGPTQP